MKRRVCLVHMKDGRVLEVEAKSYGHAARLIPCGRNQIIRFEWKRVEMGDLGPGWML